MMLGAALVKEFKLVFRDLHSLLVLFAMPAAFIVIMSLAMQEQFAGDGSFGPEVKYHVEAPGEQTAQYLDNLRRSDFLRLTEIDRAAYESALSDRTAGGDRAVYLFVPAGAFTAGDGTEKARPPVTLWLAPAVEERTRLLIRSAVEAAWTRTRLARRFAGAGEGAFDGLVPPDAIKTEYLYQGDGGQPTAVQQSVPAWLIFSMFFVVIPISTTLITERQQGTLARLRTMPVSMPLFVSAKILPYLVINQIQLILMLAVGFYLVPWLGGDRLNVAGAPAGLAIMSLATGFAALGYGLLVAVAVRTTEQATAIGGIGSILLGALGGIMVPKFVMPDYLQTATHISPMAWGLEGFLDIVLRGGGVGEIAYEAFILFVFGATLFSAALILIQRRRQ